jgi:hypothetical protein
LQKIEDVLTGFGLDGLSVLQLTPDQENTEKWTKGTEKIIAVFGRLLSASSRQFWATLIYEYKVLSLVDGCLELCAG